MRGNADTPRTDRLTAAVEELVEAIREEAFLARAEVERAPDRLLSIVEAIGALGIGRTQIYAEISAGRLRTIKVGRRRFVPASAVDEFIASRGVPVTRWREWRLTSARRRDQDENDRGDRNPPAA